MAMTNLSIGSLFPLLLLGCATIEPESSSQQKMIWQQQLETAALQELKDSGTPSLQIAVGSGGRVVFQGAWGLADLEHNVAANNRTRYRTASVSKLFTAIAAMRMVEDGQLDLDADARTYCPEFPAKRWTLTPRQLLTHTAGIRHYADYESELAAAVDTRQRQAIEQRRARDLLGSYTRYTEIDPTLESFKQDPLLFEPGTSWTYSSFGYRLLACVMEGAASQPFRTALQSYVFDPVGMTDTLDDDSWLVVPNRASGYRLNRAKQIRRADLRDVSENLPAGGHLSTATDLVQLAEAFHRGELVSKLSATTMLHSFTTNQQRTGEPTWRDAIPSANKYGAGLMFFPTAQGTRFGHTGRQAGGSAIVALIPASNLSIAIMTNAKGWNGYMSLLGTIQDIVETTGPGGL